MSTPESIVVSLDKARELKEAGFVWPTWFVYDEQENLLYVSNKRVGDAVWLSDKIPAPSAEEILRMLPGILIGRFGGEYRLRMCKVEDGWCIQYQSLSMAGARGIKYQMIRVSLADAAADMFCHLSKNNLLPKA